MEEALELAVAHPLARFHMVEVRPLLGRMSASGAEAAVQAAFKDEWGRIVATLIRRTGNWDLAEECAQEAFAQALTSWARDGVPARPGAWLTTVAGNRALDRLRRSARGAELIEQIAHDPLRIPSADEDDRRGRDQK